MKLDLADLLVLLGVTAIVVGIYHLNPWAALSAAGLAVTLFGIGIGKAAARKKMRGDN